MEGRPISAYISSKTGESCLSTGSTSARMRRMGWPPGTFWSGVMDVNVACRVVLPRIALLLSGSPSTLTDHELIWYLASPFFSTLLVPHQVRSSLHHSFSNPREFGGGK